MSAKLRRAAISDFHRVVHPEFGHVASGDGRFANYFGRDGAQSNILLSTRDQGAFTVESLPYQVKHLEFTAAHLGTKYDFTSGERPGLAPHEVHTTNSSQERLIMLRNGGGFPVVENPDGSLEMTCFYADDTGSLFRIATARVAQSIGRHYGHEAGHHFLDRMWDPVVATLEDDLRQDVDGDGLIESFSRGAIVNPNWKDSSDAYIDESGNLPKGPYKYLNNNALFIWSLRETAHIAHNLGHDEMAMQLKENYKLLQQRLHDTFWMPDQDYFAPLLDGRNEQVKFISDDPLEGLWGQVFYYDYAAKVIKRMTQPDLLTPFGVRSRSSASNMFVENGSRAYHRGSVWGHRTPIAAEGAENYGFLTEASLLDRAASNLYTTKGAVELAPVSIDNQIGDYEEDGVPVACNLQSWHIAGIIGRTARLKETQSAELMQAVA